MSWLISPIVLSAFLGTIYLIQVSSEMTGPTFLAGLFVVACIIFLSTM